MVIIVAIIALTVIELYALWCGINGALFSIIVAAIAGIAGYKLPGVISQVKKEIKDTKDKPVV